MPAKIQYRPPHPFRRARIGKPFYPPKAERITSQAAKDATEDIMRHVAELLPEQYRGAYRGAVAMHAAEDAGLEGTKPV